MDSPSRVMTIYGQMNLQDPVMGFGFFSLRQSIFSPKFAAVRCSIPSFRALGNEIC